MENHEWVTAIQFVTAGNDLILLETAKQWHEYLRNRMNEITIEERRLLSNLQYVGFSDEADLLAVQCGDFEGIKQAIISSGLCSKVNASEQERDEQIN